jgi:outer membrane protein TolC
MANKCPTRALALLSVLALSGCVAFSSDGGLSTARDIAVAELGHPIAKVASDADAALARQEIARLLKGPLSAEQAVAVALLANRGLQAAYNELGISEARFVQASLPPNPRISLSRFGGDFTLEAERQLVANLLALATLPARRDIAADRFRAAQLKAALTTLKLAADVRRQYYRAVAANHQIAFLEQARLSAEAASDLAKRLGETGGLNKLEQAREHALHAEVAAQLARARLEQRRERERLTRLMGLWGQDIAFVLPRALPPLPKAIHAARDVEQQALTRRVDLKMAVAELDALAKSLGLTNATRLVNAFELAGIQDYERSKSISVDASGQVEIQRERAFRRGGEIALEIPIFDFGEARTVEAEQTYMRAANRIAEKAVDIRSQAREAYQAYRGTYDIARLYEGELLPLRKIIQDESTLQYNAMLQDVSRLIIDARARILSQAQAVEARRDFWIAESELRASLTGGGAAMGTIDNSMAIGFGAATGSAVAAH